MRSRLVAGCCVALLLAACRGGEPPAALPEWKLGPPEVTIGAVEGDERYLFGSIVAVLPLADGRIVVGDAGVPMLRVYDARGMHAADWGRSGSGPQEFAEIRRVLPYRGDSLAVFDWGNARVAIVGPGGVVARSFTPTIDFSHLPDMLFSVINTDMLGAFPDGSVAFMGPERAPRKAGPQRGRRAVYRFSPDGSRKDSIGVVEGAELNVELSPRPVAHLRTLSSQTRFAVAGDRLLYGNAEEFAIEAVDTAFRHVGRLRGSRPLVPVTEDVEREHEDMLRAAGARLEGQRAGRDERSYARHLPAFSEILPAADGHVWVRHFSLGSAPTDYTIFSPDGAEAARLALPPRSQVMHATSTHVYVVERDELDVQRVRVHPIVRGTLTRDS